MKDEKDLALCTKFPTIFKDRNADVRMSPMAFGIACGDGWYDLLDDLCTKIQYVMDKTGIVVIADQVKEKFGTLRFYYHADRADGTSADEEAFIIPRGIIDDLVNQAESRSAHVCEICGVGTNNGPEALPHWVRVVCDKCRKEHGYITREQRDEGYSSSPEGQAEIAFAESNIKKAPVMSFVAGSWCKDGHDILAEELREYNLCAVFAGQHKYVNLGLYRTREQVDKLNKSLGVDKAHASAAQCGVLFGWAAKGADPEAYNEDGILKDLVKAASDYGAAILED